MRRAELVLGIKEGGGKGDKRVARRAILCALMKEPNMNAINRRRFERFTLQPMYTPVCVREIDGDGRPLEGHAYDVSEGGVRFELDEAVKPGSRVTMQITLPAGRGPIESLGGAERNVIVFGNVVWQDQSEPGPVRMALAITSFARLGDRERLLKSLGSGRYLRAA